jgi:hypothetical protein
MRRRIVVTVAFAVLVGTFGLGQSQDVSQLNTNGYPIRLVSWKHGGGMIEGGDLAFTFKNIAAKNILAFRVEVKSIVPFGETVTTGSLSRDGTESFKGDIPLKANSADYMGWSVMDFDAQNLAGSGSMHRIFGVNTSKLQIGMTYQQVIDAIGHPATVNHSTDANGTREQWIYQPVQSEFSAKTVYVYFENGKVTGWTD